MFQETKDLLSKAKSISFDPVISLVIGSLIVCSILYVVFYLVYYYKTGKIKVLEHLIQVLNLLIMC